MENRIEKLLGLMLVVVLCAAAIAFVGLGNTYAQEDTEAFSTDAAEENNNEEADSSATTIIFVRDPRQIDGTAYAIAILPQMVTQSQTIVKVESNTAEAPKEAQGQSAGSGTSNAQAMNVVIVLLIIASSIGLTLVYYRLRRKNVKNYKAAGFLSVLIMVISTFAVLQMNMGNGSSPENFIQVNNASDITQSSAVLSSEITDLDGNSALDVSFEWDNDSNPPYAYETDAQTMTVAGSFDETISGLTEDMTYYYRVKAVGRDYTYYSSEVTFTTPLREKTIYVHQGAVGSNNGTSWENAYTDLEVAIEAADTTDEILVALSEDPDEIGLAIRLHKSESGDILIDETLVVGPNDTLEGSGTIDSNVTVTGTHSPGHSPGIQNITGDYTISGNLEIEIGGLDPGPSPSDPEDGYDQINVSGNITLGGTLDVVLINNFNPQVGQTFEFLNLTDPATHTISGAFADATGLFGFGDNKLYFEIVETAEKVYLEVKQFGGGGIQLKALGTHAIGIGKVLCDYFSDTSYSGSLDNVDILGLIHGSVDFSISKEKINVDLDGDTVTTTDDQYTDATLITVSLTNLSLYIGTSSYGLTISSGDIYIASLKDGGSDDAWLAVLAKDIAGLLDLPGISADLDTLSVKVNDSYGGADICNWADGLDINKDGTYGDSTDDVIDFDDNESTTDDRIVYTTDYLEITGGLSGINIFGLVTGGADFSVVKQLVDIDPDGDDTVDTGHGEVSLVTFGLHNLSLNVGGSSFGLVISGGNFGLASIDTGSETWTAVNVDGISGSLTLPGISASIDSFTLEMNQYGGSAAGPLDWTTSVDLTGDGDWDGEGVVDPGEVLPTPVVMEVTYTGEYLSISGSLTGIDIFGLVTGGADFGVERTLVDVDPDGESDVDTGHGEVPLVMFGLHNLSLDVGGSGFGLVISGGSFGLASIDTGSENWTAVNVNGISGSLTLPGISASIDSFTLEMNQYGGSATGPLNWATEVDTIGDGDWDGAGVVDPGSVLPTPVVMEVTYTGEYLRISGSLTGIDIFGLVTGGADFGVERTLVDVDPDGGSDVDTGHGEVPLVMFGLDNLSLNVGGAAFGLVISGGSFGLASIDTGSESWTAVNVNGISGSLTMPGISASIDSFTLEMNQYGGSATGPLNWVTEVDTIGDGDWDGAGVVDPGQVLPTPVNMEVTYTGEYLRISGSLTSIDIFGLVTGGADFGVERTLVDVDPDGGSDVDTGHGEVPLVMFGLHNLSLNVGGSSFGLVISGGSFGLASIDTGSESWTAVNVNGISGSLTMPGISASIDSFTLEMNQYGGSATGPLDWTAEVDIIGDGAWDGAGVVDPGQVLPTPVVMEMTYTGEYLRISGSLNSIDIFGLVTGGADFGVERKLVDVDPDGESDVDTGHGEVPLVTFGLDNLSLNVGASGFGLVITGGSFGLASIDTGSESWTAVNASGINGSLTLPGVTASINSFTLEINQYGGSATEALNWATEVDIIGDGDWDGAGVVDPGSVLPTPVVMEMTYTGEYLRISGSLTGVDIFGLVTGNADFGVERKLVDVDPDGESDVDPGHGEVPLVTFGLDNLSLNVGAAGFGLVISDGSFGLASIDTGSESWTAVNASGISGSLTLPGATASIDSFTLEINQYGGSATDPLNWVTEVDIIGDGDWDGAGVVDPGSVLPTPVSMEMTYIGEYLKVGGTIKDVDIAGLIKGNATFSILKKQVDVDIDGDVDPIDDIDYQNADLVAILLSNFTLTVGLSGFGLSLSGDKIGIASIKAADGSASWSSVTAIGVGASLTLPGIDATVDNLDLEINQAYDGADVMDWTSYLDMDGDHIFGEDPADQLDLDDDDTTTGDTVEYTGQFLRVGGDLVDIDVFGIVTGSAGFEFIQDQADVDVVVGDGDFNSETGDDLNDADIVMLDLTVTNVFIGIPGSIGFELTSGQLGFGVIKPKASDNDDRSFMTMTTSLSGAELVGIQDLTLSADILEVQINRAYEGSTVAPGEALNWKTGINLDNNTDEGTPLVNTPVEVGTLTLEHETDYLRIVAGGTISAFGFFHAAASFSFEMSSTTVTVWDGLDIATQEDVEVDYLTIGTVIDNAFAGVNGPYWRDLNDDGNYEEDEINPAALGLSLKSVKFAMSLMSVKTDDPDNELDLRNWTAIKAEVGEVGFVGVEDITAKGGAFVKINTNGGGKLANVGDDEFDEVNDLVVDFQESFPTDNGLVVDTGTSSIKIDFDTNYLSVGGWMALDLFGFFYFDGAFAFEKTTTTVDTVGGSLAEEDVPVEMLTVGAKVTHAFVGSDGPYWIEDTNENEKLDAPDATNPNAFGISMTDFDFALALFKFASEDPEETDLRNWTAVSASVQQVSLVGLDNIGVSGGAAFKINAGGGGIKLNHDDVDFTTVNNTVIDFQSSFENPGEDNGLKVQMGDGTHILLDWTADYLFVHVDGALEVGGLDLSGGFSFEKEGADIGVAGDFSFEYWSGTEKLFGFSVDGAMLIKGEGVAMEFGMSLHADIASETFVFTGAGRFFMNNTGVSINEIAEEPVNLTLPTPTGKNEILKVSIETFKVKIGDYVTFEAGDIILDLTATGSDHLIEFGEAGLSLTIGSGVPAIGGLGGEVGNFAIRADFLPIILDEFYASISVEGGLSTADIGLPIPISVSELGIRFNPGAVVDDVLEKPWDFSVTLSGGLDGSSGFPIVAMVEGLEFNVGYLVDNKFPFTKIEGIQFGIEDMSIGPMKIGGKFTFGIAEVKNNSGDTVKAFYGGIEGTFSYSGIGGGLQLYVCELGPLVATISVGGLVEPTTGFVFGIDKGGFAFGGEPWPSLEGPEDLLTTPVFQDPFDTSLDAITKIVEDTLKAGHNTFQDSFTMSATGTVTNIYVQGMIKGDVTVAMNIGWPDSWGDPVPDLKLLVNGDIELLGMPLGFAGFLIDLSDPLVPMLDFAFKIPAPGNPLGFLFPSSTTVLARLDTSGIIEMPIIGIATFISETFEGVLELVLEGLAEDLEMNHNSSFSKLLLDGGLPGDPDDPNDPNYGPDGFISTEENAIVITSEFLVDRILGEDDIPGEPDFEIKGLLPTSFEALDDFSFDDVGRAIQLIGEMVPAIISQASKLANELGSTFDYDVFFNKLIEVVLDALIEGVEAAWETFDPSLTISAKIQPMIFGIPLGEPDVDVELRLDKYALQFSFEGSIRDLLLNTVFAQFGGQVIANLPAGLDGINDTSFFSFKLEFPEELFNAIVTGLSDPEDDNSPEIAALVIDLINPFTGWEVLFASTISFFGFKLGSVSGFIFGPQDTSAPDFALTTFGQRVVCLDSTPNKPDDSTPIPEELERVTNEPNLIPVNTQEQYDDIVEYGGLLLTGQLYMPDIIADPISVITTLPEWASTTVEISSGEFLTIKAVEPGTNLNNVNLIFIDGTDDGVTAGSETVVYDDSNIIFKRLIITMEGGVSTAGDVIAAINSEGTFTATTTSLSSLINTASVTTGQTTDGGPGENYKTTILIPSSDFEIFMEASSTGDQYNSLQIIFENTVEKGSEVAVYNDSNDTLTLSVENGASTAADIIAAINTEGTFTAWTQDSLVIVDLSFMTEDYVTDGGVNGIDWTLPELEWDDLTDIIDNFTKVKEYIEMIIEGLTRQSEWAKLQMYIPSPAELFNISNYVDLGFTQAQAIISSTSDGSFELVIKAREYGPDMNDVIIIFENSATAGEETVVYDEVTKTLTIGIQDTASTAGEVVRAINKEGTFSATTTIEVFQMDSNDLSGGPTSGGSQELQAEPKDPADITQLALDILNAGFIEGYSELMLFGIDMGHTFIQGTINGIRAEAEIPWLAGLTASLETGWKEVSLNQFFYDLVTSPLAETVVEALGLPGDPAEVFAFLLDESTPDVIIPIPIGGFEAMLDSDNFNDWLVDNFGVPEQVLPIPDAPGADSFDFFFGAYTPGFGGPEDSGVKRNGGFRLDGALNIEGLIEDAWFEFEIEFFNILEWEPPILIPNFIARASVPNLTLPGLIPNTNLLTISDFYIELIKDATEGLHFELEGSIMLLGLRFNADGEFTLDNTGWWGGMRLEMLVGVEGKTGLGDTTTPASLEIISPGMDNDFRIDSILRKATATVTSGDYDFELFIEAVVAGSHLNDVAIEFEAGLALAVVFDDTDPYNKVLHITVEDGETTAEEIAAAIDLEGTFTATTTDPDSAIQIYYLTEVWTSGGVSGTEFNNVKVRIIDDGTIADGSATAVFRGGEIVINIEQGVTKRSDVIAAVNTLYNWTVGASELNDGSLDGEIYLTNALADYFDFELSAEFILLINTTSIEKIIYWDVPVEDTPVEIEPGILWVHADGEILFLGMELKGYFDFEISTDGLEVTVFAGLGIGPLGEMTFSGVLIIGNFGTADDFGLVGRIEAEAVAGDGYQTIGDADVGLGIYAYFLFEINTSDVARTVSVPDFNVADGLGASGDLVTRDVTLEPGILVRAQGTLDFIDLLEANCNVTIELRSDKFYLGGRAQVLLAGGLINMETSLDVLITSSGLTVDALATVDANIVGIITIDASGQLVINTSKQWVTIDSKDYAPESFLMDMSGDIVICGVLRFASGFRVQVGGDEPFSHTAPPALADQPTGGDTILLPGEWAVSFGGLTDFFGLAWISADGWFNHEGHFAIHLNGGVQIGSSSFGINGTFTIDAGYNGAVFSFDGDGTAKVVLFGWDVAHASVEFDYNSTTGKITITGEIHLDFFFFDVDIEETFTIGFFKLPPPVFLAGSTSKPQLPGGAVHTDGKLYLNIGARAYLRDLEESEYDETVYVSHVDTIGSTEIVQVSCFGRSQKFSGVTRIIANGGSGDDMIVINEGVESSVDLRGGTGDDIIVHQGKGSGTNNVIRGDDGDDYLELGNALIVNVALHGGGHNDYIQGGPKDDLIYGNGGDDQILGGGGVDTIEGGGGSDMITGGPGIDDLYGQGGPDVFYWTWGDGQDSIINGGLGSDTMVIVADDDGEDIIVSRNASDIVVTWVGEGMALTGISIEGLDINLASGSDTFTLEDILGSGVTSIDLDLGDYDATDGYTDTVLLKGSSANDSFVLDSAGGLINVTLVGVYDVLMSNADRVSGDELIIRTYGGADTINAAAVVEDLLAMELETGEDDDILIGSPFDDILDSGAGSDIVTGGRGTDIFRDGSGPNDTDTLIEILDHDMSLFNNLFVVGTIMADDGTSPFFKSSIIDEQNADPADPNFPAPVVFPLQDTGDVYAAGAEVETLIFNGQPIFERAYLTGGNSNTLIVIGDFDNSIKVGGATLSVTPWTGEATLDNGANSGITGDTKNEYYLLNLNGSSGARISILDTGGADGYDELYIYCTDQADKVSLNTIRSNGEVTGIVIVGEPFGNGFVQKMTVVNDQELPVYYQVTELLDENGDPVLDENGDPVLVLVQRTDSEGNLIFDLTDPANPVPLYVETTTETPFPVMIWEPNADRDDVGFRGVERVTIKTLGGNDTLISDDTAVPMVVNLGDGDDVVIIGNVPQINDPGNITLEYPLGIPIADTENMTNGNSAVMTIYGEDGDDEFEVNHNMARTFLHGGAHDDTFVINTFLTLADQDNPDDIANLSTLFGGTGSNRYEYLQNAPVDIKGGTGEDTLIINGTPIGDVFIITDKYAAGAGRIVYFTELEKIAINGGGGADQIYILSSDPNLEITIRGGSGDDTIHLGGDPPTLLFDPPPTVFQPPIYQVQDPPVTVYETITWNIGRTTLSIDHNWWYYSYDSTDAANAVRNYLNAIVNIMKTYIPGLEMTSDINDIVAQSNITYSFGYGRWWIYDKEVYVTFNPPAFDLQYPRQVTPPLRTVVPDPITTDPLPFAFKADTTFDLSGILGKIIIDGGEAIETNGDQVIIHNQYSNAVSGTLTDLDLSGLGLGLGMEYENLENMTIMLGDENDTLTINDILLESLTVSMGGGNDTVNVEEISGETTILGSGGDDTINVASDSNSLEGIKENLTVNGDSGLTETVNLVAYDPAIHDPIQNQVYIDSIPNLEYVDTGGNVTPYALEEKSRIIFDQNDEVWVYVVVINPATGKIIKDLVQERDDSGNLLWRDPNGNKTTTDPGGYAPWLIPVNRTKKVPFTIPEIVEITEAGSDTLNVYDLANLDGVTATLTPSTLAVTSMPGLLTYDLNELDAVPVEDVLNILLGSGDDVFNVQGTDVVTNLLLNGGDERIYVSSTAALDLDTETDFLTGNLNEINGILNIDAGSGQHLLMLSDESTTVGDSNVLITDQAVPGLSSADISITGLAPAAITYKTNLSDGTFAGGITIWTGSGDDTIAIDGTHRRNATGPSGKTIRTITTLNTGEGSDMVLVTLDASTDGFFVLNTQQGSDVVDASTSTLGFIIFGGEGVEDEITGGQGDDVIFGDRGLVYYKDESDNIVTVMGNGGPGDMTDGIVHTDRYEERVEPLLGGVDIIFSEGGDDLVFAEIGDDLVLGGFGDDTIYGDDGDDWLLGEEGHDLMAGGLGDDTLEGGPGNDVMLGDEGIFGSVILIGGAGDDWMVGGSGDDEMYGQGGHDQMWGNEDDDTMLGGDGDDWMFGNEGDDDILGEDGDDIICGDSGTVTLTGSHVSMIQTTEPGVGDDDVIEGNDGSDFIFGGAGSDDIWGHAGNDVILGDCGKVTLSGGAIVLIETSDPDFGGNDTLEGNDGDDILFGGSADDDISGDAGEDIIMGDNGYLDFLVDADASTLDIIITTDPTLGGSDTISCGSENDIALGGTADDMIYGDDGNDLLFGDHARIEKTVGGALDLGTLPVPSFEFMSIYTGVGDSGGDDTMHGNAGDDILIGGQGDDDMYGDEGDDDMIGGHNIEGGIDELDESPGLNDRMDGGSGDDVMAGDNAQILRRTDAVSPRMRTLNGTILYDEDDISDVNGTHLVNPSGAVGRDIMLYDHNDSPTPDTFGSDYMAGGPDEDVMFGQLGDDIIQGDASSAEVVSPSDPSVEGVDDGDDYIEGNGGSDLIFGNLGQDDIIGGSSKLFGLTLSDLRPDDSDTIFGGAGTDIARNNLGDTSETGHAQDSDMILGDNGNIYRILGTEGTSTGAFLAFNYDNYSGEDGLKIIPRVAELIDYTPGGPDYLIEQAASDIGAADEIHGESGDDFCYGMVGNDILFGEGQDDDLIGGYGHDWISGGTGQDGVLGDDGRIYTSRNGIVEPLYGIDDLIGDLNKYIYSPGKVQQATINVADELKKTVNLTPFKLGDPDDLDYSHQNFDPQYADDIIYGGWGRDFLHGGDGDDAMSGAEALEDSTVLVFEDYDSPDPNRLGTVVTSSYSEPYNPGNVLGFEAYRAEEFALYDEYDPRGKIFVDAGEDFLLNFHTKDIDETGTPAENNDGDDVLFGDLGNDWLVGGTGQDHLYGGYGCDLLNCDDDLDTNFGANDAPDTDASYEDFAYGGAGRDVLIANTGGDRMADWAGEFNSYIVPYAPFGFFTVSRAPQPQLMSFLYDLSESDGADPTRAMDTGADPSRNGEPEGELGLVMQKDFDWRNQTGAPDDPQPGNIPGGARDVLRSASFNDGSMEAFAPDSGVWEVNSGALKVSAESIGGDAASVFHVEDMLPLYYEIRATINADKPTGGWKSNAYVIFDYHGPTDFKFAGINISTDKIQMGQRTPDGWIVEVQKSCKLKPNQNYNMLVAINGTVVTVVVDGKEAFHHVFDPRIIDGFSYGLNQGMVGMGSDNSRGTYDNVAVQVLPPQYTLDITEDFIDGIEDIVFNPVTGNWEIVNFCYEGTPGQDPAFSLVDLGLDRGLEANAILELEATFSTQSKGGFVFDYYGPEDYKFVLISADTNQVIIGHHTAKDGLVYDNIIEKSLRAGNDYTLFVTLKGSTLSISIDGYMVWGHVFNAITVDGGFGLLAMDAVGSFDEVTMRTDDSAFK